MVTLAVFSQALDAGGAAAAAAKIRAFGLQGVNIHRQWPDDLLSVPPFPLIGPRSVEELRDCVGALDVELSAEEWAWVNLEEAGGHASP